jgi:Rrf2 family protein
MSFSLTRKTDYALVALARLAEEAAGQQRPLSARQIAERYDLPLALLMNVLKDLHRAQIVCSRRGASGGYMLCCHDPAEVTMLQVIEALEGPVKVALCCDDEPATAGAEPCVACRVMSKCPNVTPMQRFNDKVRQFLSDITLKDLLEKESRVAGQEPVNVIGVAT